MSAPRERSPEKAILSLVIKLSALFFIIIPLSSTKKGCSGVHVSSHPFAKFIFIITGGALCLQNFSIYDFVIFKFEMSIQRISVLSQSTYSHPSFFIILLSLNFFSTSSLIIIFSPLAKYIGVSQQTHFPVPVPPIIIRLFSYSTAIHR